MVRELTYFAPRKCYKKKRNGQIFYVGKGSERDSDVNYKTAWAEWEVKLAEIVKVEQEQRQVQGLPQIIAALKSGARLDPRAFTVAGFPMGQDLATIIEQQAQEGRSTLTAEEYRVALDKARALPKAQQEAQARTVGDMVAKFLDGKRQQARTEQRSVGRFANVESYANHFRDFVGADKPVTILDAVTLADFHSRQLEAIDNDEITAWAGRDRLQVARQFIRYVYELGLIDLPRNLDSKNLTITCTPGEIKPMPVAALRERVRKANPKLKIEILLMANCGMYQVDAADLKHSEVDWKAGTIKRKRSKTKNQENAPVVTYHLWASTLELLRQQATADGALVLATRNGLATVRDGINANGKAVRTDSTAQAYTRLQDRLEAGQRWPLKSIRKLAASLIGNHPNYGRYAQYFLGQAPENVADAHYIRPSEEQFKECLTWLGKELGIDTLDGAGAGAENAEA